MTTGRIDAVCNTCGGYGVTIPAAGTKMVCPVCEGAGHYEQSKPVPWVEFEPDPQLLAWLADLTASQADPQPLPPGGWFQGRV